MSEVNDVTPPPVSCPMCGYSRSGLVEPTCPECGYTMTPEDIAHAYRWDMFLVFTRRAVVLRWMLLAGIFAFGVYVLSVTRNERPMAWVMVGIGAVMSLAGSRYVASRGVRGRTLRRAWWLAAGFGVLAWITGMCLLRAAATIVTNPWRFGRFGGFDDDQSLMLTVIQGTLSCVVGTALGVVAFKRTLSLARLTPSTEERASLRDGLRVVTLPVVLMVMAIGVLTVFRVLDRVRPEWWW